MPTSTAEDYLKQILTEERLAPGEHVSTGRIAAGLAVTAGTATTMLKSLAEQGWVDYRPYAGVRLTPEGRRLAAGVLRRHRLIERFLVDVLELDWSVVHEEAERLEHAVSERVVARIDEMLGHPTSDPHGDPIPDPEGRFRDEATVGLGECEPDRPLIVVRVLDQRPEFLQFATGAGLIPGRRLKVTERDATADTVTVVLDDGRAVHVGARAAAKVQVRDATAPDA